MRQKRKKNEMQVVNIGKVAGIKRQTIIRDYCGGQFSRKEAYKYGGIGIGGLRYHKGIDIIDKDKKKDFLRGNTETFKDGFGIYLRDDGDNYLVLLQNSEILTISFDKEIDIVKPRNFSFFQKSIKRNIPYHYAKYMLMEDEMTTLHTPTLKIITTDLEELNFECTRRNPLKIKEYFEASPLREKFIHDYKTYVISNKTL